MPVSAITTFIQHDPAVWTDLQTHPATNFALVIAHSSPEVTHPLDACE